MTVEEIMTKISLTSTWKRPQRSCQNRSKNNIRRLPVVNNGVLVGILTSADVMTVSPELTEILVENARMENQINYSSNENPYLELVSLEIMLNTR